MSERVYLEIPIKAKVYKSYDLWVYEYKPLNLFSYHQKKIVAKEIFGIQFNTLCNGFSRTPNKLLSRGSIELKVKFRKFIKDYIHDD